MSMDEKMKLLFIREIGIGHMKIADYLNLLLQLTGLLARLCAATHISRNKYDILFFVTNFYYLCAYIMN